jgi:Domain of Unknown Function (DUF928)
MIRLKQLIQLTSAFLVALGSSFQEQAQSVPTVLAGAKDAIIFNAATPPSTGQPGRRSDAGSRGCGEGESAPLADSKPLVAIVPVQKTGRSNVVFGKTAAEHPTFWFYVPPRSASTATFVLQEQDGKPVYQSDLALPKPSSIVSLTLPKTVAPLATGKLYHWFLKLYCKSNSPPISFVDGWIQREALTPDLAQQLKKATLQQQVRLYAANGVWFDALTTAANLRRTHSGDTAWAELLKAIALDTIATEPITTP